MKILRDIVGNVMGRIDKIIEEPYIQRIYRACLLKKRDSGEDVQEIDSELNAPSHYIRK